jgi:membrane-bound metal-dependent hydrolase YbcI (DUF457 family)
VPFTPFHFGPGALVKAVAPKYFSFTVFVFSQVLIDLESLYFLLGNEWPVHRFFHTYAGASLIALASFLIGRPVCGFALAILRRSLPLTKSGFWAATKLISIPAALSGAVIGAYSHVALDSIMHSDMRPFAPFADENVLLHAISIGELHLYCVIAGVLGALGLGLWWLVSKDKNG